ncbi:MAG: sodium:proton antiporter [Epsilonproteobacteria bacterium]|nr:sodium:proton antiporter [Campylobacterota bacterium]
MPENLDSKNYLFNHREDAAKKLLDILPQDLMQQEEWVILCLSNGAVSIAEIIAKKLKINYDLLFVEPIYAPNNDECQVAMVSEVEEIVIHHDLVDSFGITLDYIYGEAQRKYQHKLLEYQNLYRKSLSLSDMKERNVLLLDEGCETGLITLCALKSTLALGVKKVSVATPMIADDLYHHLEMKVDKIYTNYKVKDFIAVDYYYRELEEVKRKKTRKILEESTWYLPFKGEN